MLYAFQTVPDMKCFDELDRVTQWVALLENMASIIPSHPCRAGTRPASEAVSCVKIHHHSNRNWSELS